MFVGVRGEGSLLCFGMYDGSLELFAVNYFSNLSLRCGNSRWVPVAVTKYVWTTTRLLEVLAYMQTFTYNISLSAFRDGGRRWMGALWLHACTSTTVSMRWALHTIYKSSFG